ELEGIRPDSKAPRALGGLCFGGRKHPRRSRPGPGRGHSLLPYFRKVYPFTQAFAAGETLIRTEVCRFLATSCASFKGGLHLAHAERSLPWQGQTYAAKARKTSASASLRM